MPTCRTAELFILLFPSSGSPTLSRRRFVYTNVPDSVLSNEELLSGTMVTVQAELDIVVDNYRQQLGPDDRALLPYSVRFTLSDLALSDFRFLLIHHNLPHVADQIRRDSYCEELKEQLPKWPRLAGWTVEEDTEN